MGREWWPMLGAIGFIIMIGSFTYIMVRIEDAREKRQRGKNAPR